MPTYAYACTACGHAFEIHQSFTDDALTVCPECEGRLRKVFSAVGVVFKGSGFYRNDARAGSGAKRSGTAGSSSGSGSSATAGSGSSDSGSGGSSAPASSSSSSGGSTSGSSASGSSTAAASKPAASA
ncbi:FmdB family zinc ribbon protein [Cellulomonas alba]|uniref:Zinc ribbon domain-containing protein n=1 Tax=Cellulomonas alba TaxID=3053467 RepID=A0ABT7SHL1_9CELL|nr:FmdB family zinc ribbon protein [Cellulomonas alba]MDM7855529.1 zinc ribbon domain-containing protein [Cellulomonas alba]